MSTSTTAAVELRTETIDELVDARFGSLTGLARSAGLAPSTLARCYRRELVPGPAVIAALIRTTGKSFEQLFVIPA